MQERREEDPVLRSARREAIVAGLFWLGAITYTTIYCTLNGYGRDPSTLQFVLGFPDWIFWGVVLPWGVSLAFSAWFAFRFVRDEALEDDPPAGEPNPGPAPGDERRG